ncbi:MAG: hypothetical protein ABIV26_03105 [Candidatus Limnocylindrales bacterium]
MTLAKLIAEAVRALNAAAVPYMVTGSLASTFHGEPRATRDLDIVIAPDAAALEHLVAGLQAAGFYVDPDAARDALQRHSSFNAIGDDAMKIDFIIRRERPFSRQEFERRQAVDLLGTPGYIATAEDMIIAKLEWAAATDSERQIRDVSGILAVTGDAIDRPYVERWVAALHLEAVWVRAATPPAG